MGSAPALHHAPGGLQSPLPVRHSTLNGLRKALLNGTHRAKTRFLGQQTPLTRCLVSMDVQFPAVGGRPVSRMMFGSLVVDLGFHLSEAVASAVDVDDVAVVQ